MMLILEKEIRLSRSVHGLFSIEQMIENCNDTKRPGELQQDEQYGSHLYTHH